MPGHHGIDIGYAPFHDITEMVFNKVDEIGATVAPLALTPRCDR